MNFIDFVKSKDKRENRHSIVSGIIDVLLREKERRAIEGYSPIDIPDYILSVDEMNWLKNIQKEFLMKGNSVAIPSQSSLYQCQLPRR